MKKEKKEEEEDNESDDDEYYFDNDIDKINYKIVKIDKKIKEANDSLNLIKNNNFNSLIYKNKVGILYNFYPGDILIFNFKEKKLPIEIRKS